jgi:hypothetical protein
MTRRRGDAARQTRPQPSTPPRAALLTHSKSSARNLWATRPTSRQKNAYYIITAQHVMFIRRLQLSKLPGGLRPPPACGSLQVSVSTRPGKRRRGKLRASQCPRSFVISIFHYHFHTQAWPATISHKMISISQDGRFQTTAPAVVKSLGSHRDFNCPSTSGRMVCYSFNLVGIDETFALSSAYGFTETKMTLYDESIAWALINKAFDNDLLVTCSGQIYVKVATDADMRAAVARTAAGEIVMIPAAKRTFYVTSVQVVKPSHCGDDVKGRAN